MIFMLIISFLGMNAQALHANLRLPYKRTMGKKLLLPPQSPQLWGDVGQQDQIRAFEEYAQVQSEYQNLIEQGEENIRYLNDKNISLEYIISWRDFMYYCKRFQSQYILAGHLNDQEIKSNIDYMEEELAKLSMLRGYIEAQSKFRQKMAYSTMALKKLYMISAQRNSICISQAMHMINARNLVKLLLEGNIEEYSNLYVYLQKFNKFKAKDLLFDRKSLFIYRSASITHNLSWKGNSSLPVSKKQLIR